jgi:hypothetical protein
MFDGCSALTGDIVLPATVLVTQCYNRMFYGVTGLNSIKVYFTEWKSGATSSWLSGASNAGTFYKPAALPETKGISNIPSAWTVVNF